MARTASQARRDDRVDVYLVAGAGGTPALLTTSRPVIAFNTRKIVERAAAASLAEEKRGALTASLLWPAPRRPERRLSDAPARPSRGMDGERGASGDGFTASSRAHH